MAQPYRPSGKTFFAGARLTPLPDEIVNRPKTGFSIPVQAWLASSPGERVTGLRERHFSRDWARRVAVLQRAITEKVRSVGAR
jgi:hypothetical protein